MTTTEPEVAAALSAPPALADLAVEHWRELVGIAALLLRDRSQAEDVVQDAVVACLRGRPSLRSADAGLAYLRSAVLNRARSGLRRRAMVRQHDLQPVVHTPGADETVLAGLARSAVVDAVRGLPRRQREAVALRYWAQLSEKETAAAMEVSVGSVKAYTSRGLAAVAAALGEGEDA